MVQEQREPFEEFGAEFTEFMQQAREDYETVADHLAEEYRVGRRKSDILEPEQVPEDGYQVDCLGSTFDPVEQFATFRDALAENEMSDSLPPQKWVDTFGGADMAALGRLTVKPYGGKKAKEMPFELGRIMLDAYPCSEFSAKDAQVNVYHSLSADHEAGEVDTFFSAEMFYKPSSDYARISGKAAVLDEVYDQLAGATEDTAADLREPAGHERFSYTRDSSAHKRSLPARVQHSMDYVKRCRES